MQRKGRRMEHVGAATGNQKLEERGKRKKERGKRKKRRGKRKKRRGR